MFSCLIEYVCAGGLRVQGGHVNSEVHSSIYDCLPCAYNHESFTVKMEIYLKMEIVNSKQCYILPPLAAPSKW